MVLFDYYLNFKGTIHLIISIPRSCSSEQILKWARARPRLRYKRRA